MGLVLGQHPQLVVVGEVTDGHSLVELARQLQPGGIVTDHVMPGVPGADALRILSSELPGTVMILCTAAPATLPESIKADELVVKVGDWLDQVATKLLAAVSRRELDPAWPGWERRSSRRS